ncbi:MAG: hypothetical protein EHM64_03925 [Ignavibacteriae bacterium]|nr:MAG: hypothetical protein EHM64_03925 [Ignavibacteriota bacterium]
MKKSILSILIFTALMWSQVCAQQEAWQTLTRGLLHQSVYNTGALGVQYNLFRTSYSGDSLHKALEWPGNSYFRYDNKDYWYYNSSGAGLMLLCDTGTTANRADYLIYDAVNGAAGLDMVGVLGIGGAGDYRSGEGLHHWPGVALKTTNYPLNSDGTWNLSYDPNEAEEKIVTSTYTPYGITITRTSRAWSYRGYDSFIIHDYEFKNTGERFKYAAGVSPTHATDTLFDISVNFAESYYPSYVYGNRINNTWSNPYSLQIGRIDLKRYMQYVHAPDGRPFPNNYAAWASSGTNGGGLMSPAAVGYILLYYDYDHLMPIAETRFINAINITNQEELIVYDGNGKFKQPWNLNSSSGNLYPTKVTNLLQGSKGVRNATWNPRNSAAVDSVALLTCYGNDQSKASYWYGRGFRSGNNYVFANPGVRHLVMGPYKLAPDDAFHVVFADVAGFGPGRKWDSKYYDYGGSDETNANVNLFRPVASWDSLITYPNLPQIPSSNNATISATGFMGNTYIPTYGLPAYIYDTNVVSIRDFADRCIQMYKGNTSVIKYDTSQYEPSGGWVPAGFTPAPSPSAVTSRPGGWNAAVKIPIPAPVLKGVTSEVIVSGLQWNGAVDSIPSSFRPYINSSAKYYQVLRSTSKLGPWTILDSVGRRDSRYWKPGEALYEFIDVTAKLSGNYVYALVAVDSLGKKSALTNIITQQANVLYKSVMEKVYAVPNPCTLVSGMPGEEIGSTFIQFFGLPNDATVKVFSFSGQLIKTIRTVNAAPGYGKYANVRWDLRSESLRTIASGVYYFTVVDNKTGKKAWNKFVVIH